MHRCFWMQLMRQCSFSNRKKSVDSKNWIWTWENWTWSAQKWMQTTEKSKSFAAPTCLDACNSEMARVHAIWPVWWCYRILEFKCTYQLHLVSIGSVFQDWNALFVFFVCTDALVALIPYINLLHKWTDLHTSNAIKPDSLQIWLQCLPAEIWAPINMMINWSSCQPSRTLTFSRTFLTVDRDFQIKSQNAQFAPL